MAAAAGGDAAVHGGVLGLKAQLAAERGEKQEQRSDEGARRNKLPPPPPQDKTRLCCYFFCGDLTACRAA